MGDWKLSRWAKGVRESRLITRIVGRPQPSLSSFEDVVGSFTTLDTPGTDQTDRSSVDKWEPYEKLFERPERVAVKTTHPSVPLSADVLKVNYELKRRQSEFGVAEAAAKGGGGDSTTVAETVTTWRGRSRSRNSRPRRPQQRDSGYGGSSVGQPASRRGSLAVSTAASERSARFDAALVHHPNIELSSFGVSSNSLTNSSTRTISALSHGDNYDGERSSNYEQSKGIASVTEPDEDAKPFSNGDEFHDTQALLPPSTPTTPGNSPSISWELDNKLPPFAPPNTPLRMSMRSRQSYQPPPSSSRHHQLARRGQTMSVGGEDDDDLGSLLSASTRQRLKTSRRNSQMQQFCCLMRCMMTVFPCVDEAVADSERQLMAAGRPKQRKVDRAAQTDFPDWAGDSGIDIQLSVETNKTGPPENVEVEIVDWGL